MAIDGYSPESTQTTPWESMFSDASGVPYPAEEPLTDTDWQKAETIMDQRGVSAYMGRALVRGSYPIASESAQDGLGEIARLDRLQIVKETQGFYPTSLRELSEVFTALDFSEKPGGVAKHLVEIARHQVKHDADPVKAAVRVTTEYAGYAQNARNNLTGLLQNRQEIAGSLQNPLSSAAGMLVTRPGLSVRFADINHLAHARSIDAIGHYPLARYAQGHAESLQGYVMQTPPRHFAEYVQERLGKLRVYEAKSLVEAAIADRAAAQKFWGTQLEAIARHNTGAPRVVARGALEKLGLAA